MWRGVGGLLGAVQMSLRPKLRLPLDRLLPVTPICIQQILGARFRDCRSGPPIPVSSLRTALRGPLPPQPRGATPHRRQRALRAPARPCPAAVRTAHSSRFPRTEAKTPPPPTRTPRAKWVPFFPLASPPASSPDIHGGLAGPYAPGGRDTRCPLCSSPRSTWLSLAAAAVWVLGPAFPVSSTPGSAPSPPRPQDTSPHRVPFPVAAWSLLSSRGAETGPSGQQAFQTCVSCGSGR